MRPTVTSGPVVSYTAVSPLPACAGGLFSAALSLRSPWADVIRHRALRSPEVPQPCQMNDAAAAIWGSRISYYTAGQGFYAGESGWAGAPGETMNAECRIAVGGGAHPPAGGRWHAAPEGGQTAERMQNRRNTRPHHRPLRGSPPGPAIKDGLRPPARARTNPYRKQEPRIELAPSAGVRGTRADARRARMRS